jgi:hypothetical protein
MSNNLNIRFGWLKFMYVFTIIIAGACGTGMIIIPNTIKSIFGLPDQDPITFGIVGSVYLAFGILSILGLRCPLRFVPVLLLQLCYKMIWFIGFVLPLIIEGKFPFYAIPFAIIFAVYIIGDLIAIPFRYVLLKP